MRDDEGDRQRVYGQKRELEREAVDEHAPDDVAERVEHARQRGHQRQELIVVYERKAKDLDTNNIKGVYVFQATHFGSTQIDIILLCR